MARVTVEDCLAQVPNRFALTVLAARRARTLSEGRARPLVECENKEGVTALREIAKGLVRYKEDVDETMRSFIMEERRRFQVTTGDWSYVEAASLHAVAGDEDGLDAAVIEELPDEPEKISSEAKSIVAEDSAVAEDPTGDDEVPMAEDAVEDGADAVDVPGAADVADVDLDDDEDE